jgi:large subunit ribosomal protein L18
MNKKPIRMRRATRSRAKIKELGKVRLCVHRTPKHIYAQLIDPNGKVLACSAAKHGCNIAAATQAGKDIAEKGIKAGITDVAFDRSGFKYHGRLKALADAAREGGLKF